MEQPPQDVENLQEELAAARARIAELEGQVAQYAEKALQFDTVVEALHETVITFFGTDGEYQTIYCPPELERRYGMCMAELIGKSFRDVFPPEQVKEREAELAHLLATGKPLRKTYHMDLPGGLFWHDITVTPVKDEGGEITGLVAFIRDVTEQKHAEEALRQNEARMRGILGSLHETGVMLMDRDGRCQALWLPRELEERYGLSARAMIGETPALVDPPEVARDKVARLRRIFETGRPERTEYLTDLPGGRFCHETTLSPMRSASGEVTGIVAFIRDVTEHRKMEAELREREEQLLQAQKLEAIGRLAGGVAHDFNNLLTAIQGRCELLLRRVPGETRQDVEEIKKSAESAARLTRQLLTFSRKQMYWPEQVDLNETVQRVQSMLSRIIGEDVQVRTELADSLPPLEADPTQIEQVLVNLAVNARDAMPGGGTLTVRTELLAQSHAPQEENREFLRLTVEDTGPGIPAEIRGKIFEPFFTTKGPEQGTGLGLSTVYGIVKKHGGWIDVDAVCDGGARFRVYLPAAEGDCEPKGTASKTERSGARARGECVLLVEDEPLVRDFTERALLLEGYTVLPAATAAEAEAVFDESPIRIDVLITDMVLPDLHGLELINRLLAQRPDLPVIGISGYTGRESFLESLERRRMQFLPKPFTLEQLAEEIAVALDKRSTSSNGRNANVETEQNAIDHHL